MSLKKFKLSLDELKKFVDLDLSIQHWSLEHSKKALEALNVLSGLETLYVSRKNFLNECCKNAGVSIDDVLRTQVSPEGDVTLQLVDKPEEPQKSETT